jgi:formylglycine-generating enzyme required for sulfatase activity
MGHNPSEFKGGNKPVENISWNDAVDFCNRLSSLQAEKLAGRIYRLPTEAEWEYACRAGSLSSYCFGNDPEELRLYGWFEKNSNRQTHPVGEKKPNAWGLYDMYGNVWELLADAYNPKLQGGIDPCAEGYSGSPRAIRGGSWFNSDMICRSSNRGSSHHPNRLESRGFRIALSPSW